MMMMARGWLIVTGGIGDSAKRRLATTVALAEAMKSELLLLLIIAGH